MYTCVVTSNTSLGREYGISTRSAMKAAEAYGRCENGETVTITTRTGKPISRVVWSAEESKYIRVVI